MTIYEQYQRGDFSDEKNRRVFNQTVIKYCEYYFVFLDYRETKGYVESLELAADTCCTSIRTVKRAISMVTK